MSRRALLFAALAFGGLLKALGVVWVGAQLGFAPWVVTLSAGAWAVAPALVGWMWHRARPAGALRFFDPPRRHDDAQRQDVASSRPIVPARPQAVPMPRSP